MENIDIEKEENGDITEYTIKNEGIGHLTKSGDHYHYYDNVLSGKDDTIWDEEISQAAERLNTAKEIIENSDKS